MLVRVGTRAKDKVQPGSRRLSEFRGGGVNLGATVTLADAVNASRTRMSPNTSTAGGQRPSGAFRLHSHL